MQGRGVRVRRGGTGTSSEGEGDFFTRGFQGGSDTFRDKGVRVDYDVAFRGGNPPTC